MINIEGKQIKLQIWDTVSGDSPNICYHQLFTSNPSGGTGGLPVHHQILLPWSCRSLAGLRHHPAGHLQPPDHLAGGRQAAQQQQHGHHAHREQKVSQTYHRGRRFTRLFPVIWRPGEMSRERKERLSPENTVLSSWKLQQRLPLTLRRHLSTQPGRSTTRSRRESSTSTMRPTASRSGLSIVLQEGRRGAPGDREELLEVVVNSQAGPWRNIFSENKTQQPFRITLIVKIYQQSKI